MKKFLGLNSIEVLWKYLREYINKEYLRKTELDNIYSKAEIDSKIESLEVSGVDLTNYYTKPEIDEIITNTPTPQVTHITYSDLYQLVLYSKLAPGNWYIITDYNAAVNKELYKADVDVCSKPITFNIWVRAINSNTLSEKGFITDDNGFLADICYSIYNDDSKYDWVTKESKGVIYRMIDKYGNDCPYDFLNICFSKDLFDATNINMLNQYNHTFCKHITSETYSEHVSDIRVMNNKIEPVLDGDKLTLPKNIIFVNATSRNYFNTNIKINGTGNIIGIQSDNISIHGNNNTIPNYSKNISIRNNSSNLKLVVNAPGVLQNVDVIDGAGEIILDPDTGYTTTIAKNSAGDIKIFTLADIIE